MCLCSCSRSCTCGCRILWPFWQRVRGFGSSPSSTINPSAKKSLQAQPLAIRLLYGNVEVWAYFSQRRYFCPPSARRVRLARSPPRRTNGLTPHPRPRAGSSRFMGLRAFRAPFAFRMLFPGTKRLLREQKQVSLGPKSTFPRGSRRAGTMPGLTALFLAAQALLQAMKTNLLQPFLIATPTRVANAQLPQNQQHPIF